MNFLPHPRSCFQSILKLSPNTSCFHKTFSIKHIVNALTPNFCPSPPHRHPQTFACQCATDGARATTTERRFSINLIEATLGNFSSYINFLLELLLKADALMIRLDVVHLSCRWWRLSNRRLMKLNLLELLTGLLRVKCGDDLLARILNDDLVAASELLWL